MACRSKLYTNGREKYCIQTFYSAVAWAILKMLTPIVGGFPLNTLSRNVCL